MGHLLHLMFRCDGDVMKSDVFVRFFGVSKPERNLQTSKQTNNNVSEARGSTLEKKNASTFQGTKRKKLKEERVSK